jgi:hypothetical protein
VCCVFCTLPNSVGISCFDCIDSRERGSSTLVSDIQAGPGISAVGAVFCSSVVEVDNHRSKTMELLSLKQTGKVEDCRRAFEQLVYHIRLYDSSLSPTMLTSQFLLGVKQELRFPVEIQLPE